jgi:hypothetical protein
MYDREIGSNTGFLNYRKFQIDFLNRKKNPLSNTFISIDFLKSLIDIPLRKATSTLLNKKKLIKKIKSLLWNRLKSQL